MLGGNNGNSIIPGFVETNRVRYDNNTMPQLQLFGHVPIECGAGASTIDRVRECGIFSMQQKLHISLNPVSTGLKLSYEEEERNSYITSACENMKNDVPVMLSLGNNVKMEIDRQTGEFGRFIKLQEDRILKGVREINQQHTVSVLDALEKGVGRKLREKDLQIEILNRKNKDLVDKIKQVATEAQSWHYRAKHNESVVNVLKNNIQQLMEQNTAHAREGSGDSSEVDDAASRSNDVERNLCRACDARGVSVLILPCRHLCLCVDCELFVHVCPVCRVMKTASVHVYT